MSDLRISLPKEQTALVAPVVAEPGTYKMVLVSKEIKSNKAQTGQNLVLGLAITGEGGPPDGVTVNLYFPLPKPEDAGMTTRQGQPMSDWKMQRIYEVAATLGASIDGASIVFHEGAMCQALVVRKTNDNGELFNDIDGPLMEYAPRRS